MPDRDPQPDALRVESSQTPHPATLGAFSETAQPYRVLARKYRPTTFADLVGQDMLVRTLTNAIASGRLAHAFILTGVRGIGKTTTARILAKALNCIGLDGEGGPTAEPCGVCASCAAIAGDRHVDVMEMDAASRTGIDDIREIIEGVRYAPVSSRYKIYIIDEVHMLSRQAFNGLLKTLEEPPPHVKFIFATTEIRKVPVTVLSRCQRFDLRRLDAGELIGLFARVSESEGIPATAEALAMIARAADGSARDGLSLLDQAIAEGGGVVEAEAVARMLGLADRSLVYDLLEACMSGEAPAALALLDQLHRSGAEPLTILGDLLDLVHFITRAKLTPSILEAADTAEVERSRGGALSQTLALPVLTRAWQMLLKGSEEVQAAPRPAAALEMALIRLIHSAGLPTPGDILRRIESREPASAPPRSGVIASGGSGGAASVALAQAPPAPEAPPDEITTPNASANPLPSDFRSLVALFAERADAMLYTHLYAHVHPVRLEPGRFEFRPGERAPRDLAGRIAAALQDWTGRRWMVSVSDAPGEPTQAEQDRNAKAEATEAALRHPLVREVMTAFPGSTLTALHGFDPDESSLAGLGTTSDGDVISEEA